MPLWYPLWRQNADTPLVSMPMTPLLPLPITAFPFTTPNCSPSLLAVPATLTVHSAYHLPAVLDPSAREELHVVVLLFCVAVRLPLLSVRNVPVFVGSSAAFGTTPREIGCATHFAVPAV